MSDESQDKCPQCDQEIGSYAIGDGICQAALNSEKCCFDGGDCSLCMTCDIDLVPKVGDRYCNEDLNNMKCCFDGGDCDEYIWESKYMLKGVNKIADVNPMILFNDFEWVNYFAVSKKNLILNVHIIHIDFSSRVMVDL